MKIAFAYRPRKGQGDFEPVTVGASVVFDERVKYALSFPEGCSLRVAQRLRELGGSLVSSDIGLLSFGNFVGRAELAGATIEVTSSKIGSDGVSRVLQEISDLASSLVFGWKTPTGFEASVTDNSRSPVPYHQLQFLRRVMMEGRAGERLQDWLAVIERNPTRRFEPERPVVSAERVRRLDHRAVQSIFSRLDRLSPVPADAAVASSKLAQALTFGTPPQRHFPAAIAAPRGRLSFDTPENAFVKHVLGECLALVYRFADYPKLHDSLRDDCRQMVSMLEQAADASCLTEAGRLIGFRAPSQALAKTDGYREVFAFWNALTSHVSLPRTPAETSRLLEGRDMATLYEYWVFLKVLEAASAVSGLRPEGPPTIRRDDLGESLAVGLSSGLGPAITVRYNPSYTRLRGTAYSTPLRPDVILEINGQRHAFDAKYRLDRVDIDEDEEDDGVATYKRADLYKMHTYRDAIASLRTAFVVYPGSEFVFFERAGAKRILPSGLGLTDGVGALPLRPADSDPARNLRDLLKVLITQSAPSSSMV
ncbi:DUF2357 domain-containing protein [Paraburkholderia domus]|uniref:DUF2357 domain-containing protein n=1 Tax=Paraburkholderia domus TaxID=2793075 RepID=UPI0019141177|nr:DUF2357 domain-containing protein [Paraburkholderia domus]MBK5185948.1 DUF2357 domain-containing protein [Burkholderia sp. R-69749]CAE6887827.1 hypothetical protein R69749_07428 [Paraburkholderia domus]